MPPQKVGTPAAECKLHARGMLYSVPAFNTRIAQVGLGVRVDVSSETCRFARPCPGEHTDTVPREQLGPDEARLARLREHGIL